MSATNAVTGVKEEHMCPDSWSSTVYVHCSLFYHNNLKVTVWQLNELNTDVDLSENDTFPLIHVLIKHVSVCLHNSKW